MHVAAQGGSKDVIEFFLSKGISVNDITVGDGWTPLHYAAFYDKLDTVKFLIDQGAYIKAKAANDFDKKPMHVAAQGGSKDVIEFFLSKGVNIDDTDQNNCTPLHYAAWQGELDTVKFLVSQGANVNAKDNKGNTPLDLATTIPVKIFLRQPQLNLINAARQGNLDMVTEYVSKGVSLNAKDDNNRTPLHWAALNDHLNVVKYLISRGANLHIIDKNGYTPLHRAAGGGALDVVKYFIEEEHLDINLNSSDDSYHWTPLHIAAYTNKLDIVKYLIDKGADINAVDTDSSHKKPIHVAAQGGHKDIIEFLLSKGVSVNSISIGNGWTPLHYATWKGHLDTVKFLVERGADINAIDTDSNHRKPIHIAAQGGSKDIIEFFLNEGMSVNDIAIGNGWTPLHYTAWKGHVNTAKFLVERGANINAKDNISNTPIILGAWHGQLDIVTYFISDENVNVNTRDGKGNDGRTILHYAAQNDKLEVVKFLVEKGADINAIATGNGWTPLHYASWNGHMDVVKYLVEKGSNVNAQTNNGDTALDLALSIQVKNFLRQPQLDLINATKQGNLNLVKEYVNKGVSLDARDDDSYTPLHWAARNSYLDVVKYLIDKGANLHTIDEHGYTPFHRAVEGGALDIVKYFIEEKHLDVNLHGADGGYHWTPLHWAAYKNKLDVVKYLIDKDAALHATDKNGYIPLHRAAEGGALDVVKYFIEEKLLDINLKGAIGGHHWSSLHLAAQEGKLDVVKYLMENGANVHILDAHNYTPLHRAVQQGKLNIVKYLIEEVGVSVNEQYHWKESSCFIFCNEQWGPTPLKIAEDNGHNAVASYLKSKGSYSNRNRRDISENRKKYKETNNAVQEKYVTSGASIATSWLPQLVIGITQGLYNFVTAESKRENINQFNTETSIWNIDVNGIIMLFDVLVRKVTGQKYVATAEQSVNAEAQSYALNIIEKFEQWIRDKYGIQAGESINLAEMQSKIYYTIKSGNSRKIPDIFFSYATPIIEAAELLQSTKPAKHQTYPFETASKPQTCLNRPLAQPISDKHRQGCI
nr:ankyrin repeat domain-containing protein [Wolbachia endosymbiont of Pentalonia nigronervosa]